MSQNPLAPPVAVGVLTMLVVVLGTIMVLGFDSIGFAVGLAVPSFIAGMFIGLIALFFG